MTDINLNQDTMLNYYQLLELPSNASPREIELQYLNLKGVYEDDLGTFGLLLEEDRQVQLAKLEQAYRVLIDTNQRLQYDDMLRSHGHQGPWYAMKGYQFKSIQEYRLQNQAAAQKAQLQKEHAQLHPTSNKPLEPMVHEKPTIVETDVVGGAFLKQTREQAGLSLGEVSKAIKITMTQLQNIEAGDLSKLPAEVYLRGFLKSYAQFLRLDAQRVLQDYFRWAAGQHSV